LKNVAQIGAGRMGALHAANASLNPRIDFKVIADNKFSSAEALAATCGAVAASVEDVIADKSID